MTSRHHVTITSDVYDELAEIHKYVAADAPDRAADLVRAIVRRIDALETAPAASPRVGRQRSTGLPIHATHERSFMIYYTVRDSPAAVTVLAIIRAARRQPRRFE